MPHNMPHNFDVSLAASHAVQNLPFWEECYRNAFPAFQAMVNHRDDGPHQRAGVDRSIILTNAKQILSDEKVRGRNKKTGKIYADIALEYLSDDRRQTPGWVCKPLLADYITYAIAPLGVCYLLPVEQLQRVWKQHGQRWIAEAGKKRPPIISAANEYNGRKWNTLSVAVEPGELFPLIGACLRPTFTPYDPIEGATTQLRIY